MADSEYMRAMPLRNRRDFGRDEVLSVLRYEANSGTFRWIKAIRCHGGGRPAMSTAGTEHQGYVQIKVYGRVYRAHHLAWLIMTGEWPPEGGDVDHIDRNRANNAWSNLRPASRAQNNVNSNGRSDNKSGQAGVSFRKDTRKWHARITFEGRIILLGNYERLEDAIAARQATEKIAYGAFVPTRGVPQT